MSVAPKTDFNVRQVVPFFRVSDMDRSVRSTSTASAAP